MEVENTSFTSNHAYAGSSTGDGQVNGQRADALGGAVAVEGGGIVSLVRVVATENDVTGGGASQYGGGGFGGAVYAEDSTLSIADSLIQSNAARGAASVNGGFAAGGGVLLFNSDGAIDRSRIIANRVTGGNSAAGQFTGTGGGGGLYLWRSDPSVTIGTIPVTNTVIADNTVELGQGGNNPGGGGGGLQVQGLFARLTHVTLAGNHLGTGLVVGQAMVILAGNSPGSADLSYSVIADHVASSAGATAIVVLPGSSLALGPVAFTGNTHDINSNSVPLPPGNITGFNNMFTVDSAGFVAPGPPTYDYHIRRVSPLRSRATGTTVTVDMDNQPRSGSGCARYRRR